MLSQTERPPLAAKPQRSLHRPALPAMLIGVLLPIVLLVRQGHTASDIAHTYLIAIFVITAAAFVYSVFEPGEVTAAEVHQAQKVIAIERTGLLARSVITVPFSDIIMVRMETRYDSAGLPMTYPALVLTTRQTLPLPTGTTESDIVAIRTIIGRHG